jgi:MoxR-like ATPase
VASEESRVPKVKAAPQQVKPIEQKVQQPTPIQPVKPVEQKPLQVKPVEQKTEPQAAKPVEQKVQQAAPVQPVKPVEQKPAAASPAPQAAAAPQPVVTPQPQAAAAPHAKDIQEEKDAELVARLGRARTTLLNEIHKVIVGQNEVLEQILITLFCRAHALMVGVPGVAKTLMVRTISQTLNLQFKRIQFTPDLMPSDITGTEVLEIDPETQARSFKFIPGPVFTNLLLADEINRTPPKTQAALLECMQEYRVTSAGKTYNVPQPFFVLATQNPIEQEGTYPLPEAQLDRFMMNIMVGYPTRDEEIQIIKSTTIDTTPEIKQVMTADEILRLQHIVRRVPVSEHVIEYATDLVRATRPDSPDAPQFIKDWIEWGAGPRACQYLVLGAKAHAVIDGRFNVSCSDVRAVIHPILRHRIATNFNADSEGITNEMVIDKLLENIPEPDEETYARKAKEAKEKAALSSATATVTAHKGVQTSKPIRKADKH